MFAWMERMLWSFVMIDLAETTVVGAASPIHGALSSGSWAAAAGLRGALCRRSSLFRHLSSDWLRPSRR